MTYHRKKDWIEALAEIIKDHIKANPKLVSLTLYHLHEHVASSPSKSDWEQALHRLNLQGIVSKAKHGKTYCCGKCRQDYWVVYADT